MIVVSLGCNTYPCFVLLRFQTPSPFSVVATLTLILSSYKYSPRLDCELYDCWKRYNSMYAYMVPLQTLFAPGMGEATS